MATHPAHTSLEPEQDQSPRVLIVDNEPAVQFAYQRLFEREGIVVDIAVSCREAVRRILRFSYLAVLADRRLAGCGGCVDCGVLGALHSVRPQTALIVADESDGAGSVPQAGQVHYFEKPVQPGQVLELIRSLTSS